MATRWPEAKIAVERWDRPDPAPRGRDALASRADSAVTRLRSIARPASSELPEDAAEFLEWLGGPTSIHVRGRDPSRVRVATTLLHGNEPSGLRALLAWLRSGSEPAVDTRLIVASVEAARKSPGFAHRMLPGQRDLNRCFHGPFDDPQGALAAEIVREIRDAAPEALIDIHNNTGHNPAYGVGVEITAEAMALVTRFGSAFVGSHLRLGALMEVVRDIPSVTVEVGRTGDPTADAVALRGLTRFLGDATLEAEPGVEMRVLVTPMRVCVRKGASLVVSDAPPDAEHPADLVVRADLDRHNFERVEPGTLLGWVRAGTRPLELLDEDGRDRADFYFESRDGALLARRPIIPIMITTDPAVAAADCLFYVVRERDD